MARAKELLIVLSSFLPGDLFTKTVLVVQCNLRNQGEIQTCILLDTGATGITFVDKKMACYICKILQISFIKLAKPKPIKRFNSRPANLITHAIYPTLTIQGHTKLLTLLLVTKLGQHPIILGKLWMCRHGVILDMSCDKLTFLPGHCKHFDIEKKTPVTSEKEVERIALAPSLSKLIRDQET